MYAICCFDMYAMYAVLYSVVLGGNMLRMLCMHNNDKHISYLDVDTQVNGQT